MIKKPSSKRGKTRAASPNKETFPDAAERGRPRVSAHALDIVLKLEAEGLAVALPAYLNLPLAPIARALPTELPQLSLHTERLDSLFELTDGTLLHLEYQSEHRPDTLKRFFLYDVAVVQMYDRRLRTIVFYGPNVATADEHLDYDALKYDVTAFYMGARNGEAILHALQEKAARGDTWDDRDRLDLAFLPLMKLERPMEEVVRATLRLVPALPEDVRTRTTGVLMGLAYHYLGESVFDGLIEELKTMSAWVEILDRSMEEGLEEGWQKGLERGLEQGLERGLERARREDILKVLEARFGTLPSTLTARLNQRSSAQLNGLFDAALTVSDLETMTALLSTSSDEAKT